MPKNLRKIESNDLLSLGEYSKIRKERLKIIREIKKYRRISIGPDATFYFESYETMLHQIQEMLYIEKGGSNQLKDELNAYNPLIPNGRELVATLMFEIDNALTRVEFLNRVGGIEERVFIQINSETINSTPENDVDRTSPQGKASSVQFIHFNFTKEQIEKFKNLNNVAILGINHHVYNHMTKISELTRKALIKDFS